MVELSVDFNLALSMSCFECKTPGWQRNRAPILLSPRLRCRIMMTLKRAEASPNDCMTAVPWTSVKWLSDPRRRHAGSVVQSHLA